MKKSLVLAIALTLGVAGSAYAANPFSDLPANHWAYASVSKMVAAGVIDGMGDGTFQGDRSITRYEAAQMVAKAMAKGVNTPELKRLAAEFANELNNLGVRVAKLESKVQMNGEMRLRYRGVQTAGDATPATDNFQLRTRLHLNGTVNQNWKSYVMLENIQKLDTNAREGDLVVRRAMVTGKYGAFTTQIGRIPYSDKDAMLFNPGEMDGITAAYQFDKVNVKALYGRFSPAPFYTGAGVVKDSLVVKDDKVVVNSVNERTDTLGLAVDYQADRLGIGAAFYNHRVKNNDYKKTTSTSESANVWDLLATYKIADAWKLSAMYIGTNKDFGTSKNGYAFRVGYGNYSPAKVGSYLVQANYYKIPQAAYYGSPYAAEDIEDVGHGAKGWSVAADYALEKNVKLHASYNDAKGLHAGAKSTKLWTGYATFYF